MEQKQRVRIRTGDRAKVLCPERFVRCGYALTPKIAKAELLEKYTPEIDQFLKSIEIEGYSTPQFIRDHRAIDAFLNGLGFLYTRARGFGGDERKIFTQPLPWLDGLTVWVRETRQVMTGTYYGPSGGVFHTYYGEDYDVDPGGLHDRVSNKICHITVDSKHRNQMHMIPDAEEEQWNGLWIEERHLEKVDVLVDV